MILMREMPVRSADKILAEHDTRLWRVACAKKSLGCASSWLRR